MHIPQAERLRVRVASRDQLFSDLDKLYKLVFDGPTPGKTGAGVGGRIADR